MSPPDSSGSPPVTVAPAQASDPALAFAPAAGTTYLDAATYGLPPLAATAAMEQALAAWSSGRGRWVEDWDRPAESCRADFAALCRVEEASVALLPALSVGAAMVAAGLGPGDEVAVPEDEFTSLLFPLLVARERGVHVREVPFEELPGAVTAGTTLVAASLVQMQTGRRADLAALLAATDRVGARIMLDVTQAVPFLDAGEDLSRVDFVLASAYKHLLCPRGVAFMVVRPDRQEGLAPLAANWRAADQPYGRFFGGPLTLGPGARGFDVSLAWLPWVGARESLRLLVEWRDGGALDEVRRRARDLGAALGAPPPASTLVCAPVLDPEAVRGALDALGIRASVRGSALRLSVHLWNRDTDVLRTATALRPLLATTER